MKLLHIGEANNYSQQVNVFTLMLLKIPSTALDAALEPLHKHQPGV